MDTETINVLWLLAAVTCMLSLAIPVTIIGFIKICQYTINKILTGIHLIQSKLR